MATLQRTVRFYEIRSETGQRLQLVDYERHFFDVLSNLRSAAAEHWQGERGQRVRGRVYRATQGPRPRIDLLVIDRVHREPTFNYVQRGQYTSHQFNHPDREFAEPKFLALLDGANVLATFTSGVSMAIVEAAINTWRSDAGLAPVTFHHVIDSDRLRHLASAERVSSLDVKMPAHVAAEVFRNRGTPLARFFRSRSTREGQVSVSLRVEVDDVLGTEELREELAFLVEDADLYGTLSANEDTLVEATYYDAEGAHRRHHSFLAQRLGASVTVQVDDPELGPTPEAASEALLRAMQRKRDDLLRALGAQD